MYNLADRSLEHCFRYIFIVLDGFCAHAIVAMRRIVLNLFYALFYCIVVLVSYSCSYLHVCLSMWRIYICSVYVLWDRVLQIQDHEKGHLNSTGSAYVVATKK